GEPMGTTNAQSVGAAMALAIGFPENPLDRFARYEARLQGAIRHNLRELERLRGKTRGEWADLPPGPYVSSHDRGNVQPDATGCNQTQPDATGEEKVRNEPTEEESVV